MCLNSQFILIVFQLVVVPGVLNLFALYCIEIDYQLVMVENTVLLYCWTFEQNNSHKSLIVAQVFEIRCL